ncbi:MAG: hypothetical protein A2542_03365 [Parcubacteria group bacterium RIFOXYD2_FULL_52_8]|nr:MAG: hypothetical protein A2542_03365 [Parcubacteria group bacterium RIFOXYD2_FULL_52_8]
MGFFSSKEAGKTILVIDVGSSRVMCAYVRSAPGARPVIRATSSVSLPVGEQFVSATYLNRVVAATKSALHTLSRTHKEPIAHVVVTLSSLLYVSQVRTDIFQYISPLVITEEFLQKQVSELAESVRRSSPRGVLLDKKLSAVSINGYLTEHPLGKKADSLELSCYVSCADAHTLDALRAAIQEALHTEDISMHSFGYAAWKALREPLTLKNDCMLIAGGEITEMLQLREGSISTIATLPFGKNRLIRELTRACGSTPAVAASLLRLSGVKKLAEETHRVVEQVLTCENDVWRRLSVEAAAALPQVPTRVVLVSDPIMESFVLRAFSQSLSIPVVAISRDTLLSWCDHTESATQENYLQLAALFSATL